MVPEYADRLIFLSGGAFTLEAREFLDKVPGARIEKPCEVRRCARWSTAGYIDLVARSRGGEPSFSSGREGRR